MSLEIDSASNIEYGISWISVWNIKGQFDFVDKWFLMGSPVPIHLILFSYLLFVVKLGPDLLKNRKPYPLTNVLLVYNVAQVLFSVYMFYRCMKLLMPLGFIQNTCYMETEESRYLITSANHLYLISKLTELLDTVFFVFRKKQNQVTFLHVYHHFVVTWFSWMLLKYEPGFNLLFAGTINSFVHIVMYTYYGLSAFPSMMKYLWWKKYITKLQLCQFAVAFIHFLVNLVITECKPSIIMSLSFIFNLVLFMCLFSKFYTKAYLHKYNVKRADKTKIKNEEKESINGFKKVNSEKLKRRKPYENVQEQINTNGANYSNNTAETNINNRKGSRPIGENV